MQYRTDVQFAPAGASMAPAPAPISQRAKNHEHDISLTKDIFSVIAPAILGTMGGHAEIFAKMAEGAHLAEAVHVDRQQQGQGPARMQQAAPSVRPQAAFEPRGFDLNKSAGLRPPAPPKKTTPSFGWD